MPWKDCPSVRAYRPHRVLPQAVRLTADASGVGRRRDVVDVLPQGPAYIGPGGPGSGSRAGRSRVGRCDRADRAGLVGRAPPPGPGRVRRRMPDGRGRRVLEGQDLGRGPRRTDRRACSVPARRGDRGGHVPSDSVGLPHGRIRGRDVVWDLAALPWRHSTGARRPDRARRPPLRCRRRRRSARRYGGRRMGARRTQHSPEMDGCRAGRGVWSAGRGGR